MGSDIYGMNEIFKKESIGFLNECEPLFEALREEAKQTNSYDIEKIKAIKNSIYKVKKSSIMLDIDYIIDFISQIEKILNLIIDYKIGYNPNLLQFLEISKSQIGYMIEFFALNGDVELEARLQKVASNVLQKLSTLTQNSMLSEEESEELIASKMAETLPDTVEPLQEINEVEKELEEEIEPITVAVQEVQEINQNNIEDISTDTITEIAQEESEEVGDDFFGGEDKTSPFPSSFTISDIDKVKESFTNQLDMTGDFVVNFSAVNEIDTAGMQLIVAMKKYCDTEGIEYKVTNPSLALTSAFEKLNIELGA
jgi:anti-anti-sigma regulatory factor